jgi:hypothetical protein
MKWIKPIIGAVILGIGIFVGTQWVSNAESAGSSITPGSVDDPLVTKSYVDQKLGTAGNQPANPANNGTEASSAIKIVTLKNGQILIAKDGTEVIVRAGKAVAYSGDANGIADVTEGKDITNGNTVLNNHLIVFPRGGRGITTDPGTSAGLTVMVRGGYEIK